LFAIIAGAEACVTTHLLAVMGQSLRRSVRPPTLWLDEQGRAGVAAGVAGLLPEDVFDRQPLLDRGLAFACQARLDNRDELMSELSVPRCQWPVLSDSDVLYRCYRQWGQRCVQKIFGDYVFAAWHRDSGKLVAAVDHFASAPLFYAECGTTLVASPQLAVVLACPQVPRDLNLQALGALLAPKSLIGATPYRAVRALPAGHLLIRDAGRLRLERWWQPDRDTRTHYRDPRNYVALASALFGQSVQARLRTTGAIATTMSGGLDSTLVSATAARLSADRGVEITAYTSVPEPGLARVQRQGWDSCDFEYAAAVARMHPNVRHVSIQPGGLCPLDLMPAIHAHSRTPVRNSANHLWLGRISRIAAESGARIILTGQRGNSSISASGNGAIEELLRAFRWRAALQCAVELRHAERRSISRSIAATVWGPLKRTAHWQRAVRFPGTAYLNAMFRSEVETLLIDDYAGLPPNEFRGAFLTSIRQPWLADPLVQWGVQWRDPTSDRRLVESLLSFPIEAFTIGGRHRGLARAMGEGLLPDIVRLRRTQGSQAPEHPSMVAAHCTKYRNAADAVAGSALFRSICDLDYLRHAIQDLASGSMDRVKAQSVDRALDAGLFIAANETTQ
jgi:asparagine synthase (glutamine-hydrolysing)